LYDKQNRIIETGQFTSASIPSVITNVLTNNDSTVNSYIYSVNREDVVATSYDTLHTIMQDSISGTQDNLRKRVSAVKYFRYLTTVDTFYRDYDHAAYYSYDIAGNVKGLYHHFPMLTRYQQQYKSVHYDYDLISGKVNMLSYNRGFADQFYQRYEYDVDNRITKVESSQDGIIWQRDAGYEYYQHGPLARMSLGDLRVQGVDYVYTIQGWLKAINSDFMTPANDAGKDGDTSSVYANDAFAMTLQYFLDDYESIGGDTSVLRLPERANKNLYNGNISRQVTNINSLPPLAANYTYDQLNRINKTNYDAVFGAQDSLDAVEDYFSSFSYDPDGNLLKLKRRGNGTGSSVGGISFLMDSLTYEYSTIAHNNRLVKLTDSAVDNYTNDIKYDTTTFEKFQYDETGNLVKDLISRQDTIKWNLYNKVIRTENRAGLNNMDFFYDGAGNRISKVYNQQHDTFNSNEGDYYVRDAQGNILATYKSEMRYKYVKIIAYKNINDQIRTHVGTGPFISYVEGTYHVNNDMATAISNVIAGNSGWSGPYVEGLGAAYFAENGYSVRENLILNGDDYIIPLFEHNSAHVISTAWKEMFAAEDSLYILQWTKALFGDGSMTSYLFEKMCDADPAGDFLMAEMLIGYSLITSGNCVTDAGVVAGQLGGTPSDADLVVLAGYLTNAYLNGTAEFEYYLELLAGDNVIYNHSYYTGAGGKLLPAVQNEVFTYGNMSDYYDFLNNWDDAYDYLVTTNTMEQLIMTQYSTDHEQLFIDYSTDCGYGFIDTGLAAIESLGVETYTYAFGESYPVLGPYLPQVLDVERKTTLDHFNLAEHHVYGSSRLGVKHYFANQHFFNTDYTVSPVRVQYSSLLGKKPWYSAEYQDVIFSDSLQPYLGTFTGRETFKHFMGQKGYELNNHLGNVQAVVTDKKLPVDLYSNDSVAVYKPSLRAVYDYYPFGMLMPGRHNQDTSIKCITVVHPASWTFIQINTIDADLYADGLIWAPGTGYNATAVGSSISTGVVSYEDVDYYSMSTAEVGAGLLQNLQLDAGKDTKLILDIHSIGSSGYEAKVSQFINNQWEEMVSEVLYSSGETEIDLHPAVTDVKLEILRTTADASMVVNAAIHPRWVIPKVYQDELEITICSRSDDNYRFGFNGQEKVNEIAGIGNHNTALFWEYDTRLGRRWNLDPKTQIGNSNYATFKNNPIYNNDIDGDIPNPIRLLYDAMFRTFIKQTSSDFLKAAINERAFPTNIPHLPNYGRIGRIYEGAVIESVGEYKNTRRVHSPTSPSKYVIPDMIGNSAVNVRDVRSPAIIQRRIVFDDAHFVDAKFTIKGEVPTNRPQQIRHMIDVLAAQRGGTINGVRNSMIKASDYGAATLTLITPSGIEVDDGIKEYAMEKNVNIILRHTEMDRDNPSRIRVAPGESFQVRALDKSGSVVSLPTTGDVKAPGQSTEVNWEIR